MSNQETYSGSGKTRPKQNLSGGFGKYCSIPDCKSACYDSKREKTGISLFQLPSKEPERSEWLKVFKNIRRGGGSDNFNPDKQIIHVCEFHFKPEDIRVTLRVGRKKVRQGRLPSIFPFIKEKTTQQKRKSPFKRYVELETSSSESIVESDSSDNPDITGEADFRTEDADISEIQMLTTENFQLKKQIEELQQENAILHEENLTLKSNTYNHTNISNNKEQFRSATGLEFDSFETLYDFLNPGENCRNIKFHDTSKRLSEETYTTRDDVDDTSKPGPKPKLAAKEQLFLYLTWLKNGFTLTHTSWLFNIPKATVSRYLITWSNFCYYSLGSISICPTREQVNSVMPESFKMTYPSTRCILDCTELFCQRPSSLATQSSLYSHYKSHVTYKGLP